MDVGREVTRLILGESDSPRSLYLLRNDRLIGA